MFKIVFPSPIKFWFSHHMNLDQLRFRGFRRKQLLLFCWQIYKDNYSVFHKEKTIFCSFTNFWIYHITWNHSCIKFNGLMPFSCIHGTGLVFFLAPKRCTTEGWWPTTQSHPVRPRKAQNYFKELSKKRWSKTRTVRQSRHLTLTFAPLWLDG